MQELCHLVYCCCYKDLAMNIFRVKLRVCLFSRDYNTIQFAYLPCASWSTAFLLNGFSPIVSSIHHAHIIDKVLSNICTFWCSLSCSLFYILLVFFCALMLSFDKSRAFCACSTNIKDKNRLRQLSWQFLEWITVVLKNIVGKKKRDINLLGLFMKNSSFFYVFEITRTHNNVHGFWNVWMKVIQTYGYYQNQIPTQHWMREDHSHSLVMWAWWNWCQLGLPWQNKHGDAVLQDASGKQALHPTHSTIVSRSVASKPEIVFWVHTMETTSTLMYQTTTPLDLELINTHRNTHKQSNGQSKHGNNSARQPNFFAIKHDKILLNL